MMSARALLLVLFGILLCGCAAGDRAARRSGLLIEPGPARELGYTVNWSVNLDISPRQQIDAQVLGDVAVVLQRPSNLLTVLSLRDGHTMWSHVIGRKTEVVYPPARAGDVLLVNTQSRLYGLRVRDGNQEFLHELDRVVATGPLVVGNTAILGGVDGTLFGHDFHHGVTTWRYALSDRITARPLLIDDVVFAGDAQGAYAMVTAREGTLVWRGRTFGAIVAQAGYDDANLYVPSRDQTLYAVDRESGRDLGGRWPYRATVPLTESPVPAGSAILLPLPGQGLVALEAETGEQRWLVEGLGARPIAQREDEVLAAERQRLMLIDLDTGRITRQTETRPLESVLAGPDQSLLLVSPTGRLLRLNLAQ